ncbi:PREDICTED: protein CCSMST1 [Nanorana parkeri]|uniref:protein CCSMST1 n=1 Tax=Nanorana parkeri TaxID=125878 RepID=UPI00085487DC|nr:PREDICTED: protein CCSMST1 [Nanorana parkeri]
MKGALCRISAERLKQSFVAACSARMVHLKKHPDHKEEENSKPFMFSTSKASHRQWTVEKSLGSEHQRPLWKVLPISLLFTAVLIWAAFRKETKLDKIVYRPISEVIGDTEKSDTEDEKGK